MGQAKIPSLPGIFRHLRQAVKVTILMREGDCRDQDTGLSWSELQVAQKILKLESSSGGPAKNSSATGYSSSEHTELTPGAPLHSGSTPDGHHKNGLLNDHRPTLMAWLMACCMAWHMAQPYSLTFGVLLRILEYI